MGQPGQRQWVAGAHRPCHMAHGQEQQQERSYQKRGLMDAENCAKAVNGGRRAVRGATVKCCSSLRVF